jgi:hypothetical protein
VYKYSEYTKFSGHLTSVQFVYIYTVFGQVPKKTWTQCDVNSVPAKSLNLLFLTYSKYFVNQCCGPRAGAARSSIITDAEAASKCLTFALYKPLGVRAEAASFL